MVSEKSKANLRRGNPRNRGNKTGRAPAGATWAERINFYASQPANARILATLELSPGTPWKDAIVLRGLALAALGNAPIWRELMQRSEPQEIGIAHSGKLVIEIVEDTTPFATSTRGAGADTE